MKRIIKGLKLNKKGFTLLECVVAIAIIGIMCSSMLALFQQGIKFIAKTQKLDQSSGQASEILATNSANSTYLSTDGGDNYYVDNIPVKIQIIVTIGESVRNLGVKEYDFQAGVVLNSSTQTRVVYYDISLDELKNLK